MPARPSPCLLLPLIAALVGALGCGAVFPELSTRVRPMPAGAALDPEPPEDLRWLRFTGAVVPPLRADGRTWRDGDGLADTYARLLVGGKVLLSTPTERGTLTPSWPKGPRGNHRLARTDRLRVELWSSQLVNDVPVCIQELGSVTDDQLTFRLIRVFCDNGAELTLAVEPAHPVFGAGFWFDLRRGGASVTRVLSASPAERAGLEVGDSILELGGRSLADLTADEVRSQLRAIPAKGVTMKVEHPSGALQELTVREGPIYPEHGQYGPVD